MNRPPARHPVFVALACISLVGAWTTGAFEVEQAVKEPASVDRAALLRDAPDCLDVGSTRRAVCLYESTVTKAAPAAPARHAGLTERSTLGYAAPRAMLTAGSSAPAAKAAR